MTKETQNPNAERWSYGERPGILASSFFRRLWLVMSQSAGLALLMATSIGAVERVQLRPYPQKVRTFYSTSDPAVPAGLHSNSIPLPVGNVTATARASDGAVWLGATQGLLRLDFTAPERDRRQYLAGRRYLPDDHVEQLLADDRGGIWARTHTGVSHLELKPMTLA